MGIWAPQIKNFIVLHLILASYVKHFNFHIFADKVWKTNIRFCIVSKFWSNICQIWQKFAWYNYFNYNL